MPNPSVALCSPKPTISVTARLIEPAAAAWPIASPSPKLWTPIPTAIRSASCLPGVSSSIQRRYVNSSTAAAPGPTIVVTRRLAPAPHPDRVVDEPHQAEREPRGAQP